MAFLGMFKLECIEEDLKTIKKGNGKMYAVTFNDRVLFTADEEFL